MKLISMPSIVFVFCMLLLNVVAKGQCVSHPTVSSPPIYSQSVLDTAAPTSNATTVICNGKPLTLSSTKIKDCPNCTYQWSNGQTGPYAFALTAGTYRVTVTDNTPNGCVGISSDIIITTISVAQPQLARDSFFICTNGGSPTPATLAVTNPCGTCYYQWFNNRSPNPDSLGTSSPDSLSKIIGSGNLSVSNEFFVRASNQPFTMGIDSATACYEDSKVVTVKTTTVTNPPIAETTRRLCTNNSVTLSTPDCNGCTYQWNYYDLEETEKLVITNVFHATRPGETPTGVELYAIGNIPNLNLYQIEVQQRLASSSLVSTGTFTFPQVSAGAGTYIYVTDNAVEFTNYFGFSPNYVDSNLVGLDGNDAIVLKETGGNTIVDQFGDTTSNTLPTSWTHNRGWAHRDDEKGPNIGFLPSDWSYGNNRLTLDRPNNYWTLDSMPVGTYSGPTIPTSRLMITGIYSDSSKTTTNPRGIELYATGNIPDLRDYRIHIVLDTGVTPIIDTFTGSSPVPVLAGTYIYIGDTSLAGFNAAMGTLSSVNNRTTIYKEQPLFSSIDGNDAVELYQNGTLIDRFGVNNPTGAVTWSYEYGWAQRQTSTVSTTFTEADWTIVPNAWPSCITNDGCTANNNNSYDLERNNAYTTYASPVIISGILDGQLNTNTPRGIEFTALESSTDLADFSVKITSEGSSPSSSTISLSTIIGGSLILAKGEHVYLTQDAASFNILFPTITGSNLLEDPSIDTLLDGNDVVELIYNGNTVDIYGSTTEAATLTSTSDYGVTWAYQDGWAYRNSNSIPNNNSWNASEWVFNHQGYRPRNNSFTAADRIPIQSYVNTTEGTVVSLIPNTDTSVYSTTIIGDYSVQVEYPNGCIAESNKISIDTFIFQPTITALMPSSGDTSSTLSYLCFGSTVVLSVDSVFIAPPTWSYQWSKNGIDLVGETGFSYTATSAGLYRVAIIDDNGCLGYSNVITVVESNNGANPSAFASSIYVCNSSATVSIITPTCSGCSYFWKTEQGAIPPNPPNDESVLTASTGGYFVEVTDSTSGCTYSSPIILIQDTIYPAPVISTNDLTSCNLNPITLESNIACAGCSYLWSIADASGNFIPYDTVSQSTVQINTSGQYNLEILYSNGCQTSASNIIPATFQTVNAAIATPSDSSICNGQGVVIAGLPIADSCIGCDYQFLRNGIPMQKTNPIDSQEITLDGVYDLVITDTDGCADTTEISVSFQNIAVSTAISTSPNKICSNTSSVTMSVPTCTGCKYQWYIGGTGGSNINTATSSSYTVSTYAAQGVYRAEVELAGCIVSDSVILDTIAEWDIEIRLRDSTNLATICDGNPLDLIDTYKSCPDSNCYQYQWYRDGSPIVGASFESYQASVAGSYYVEITDPNNCTAISNIINVQAFSSIPGLALDFTSLGSAIPITYGTLNLNDYLTPTSLQDSAGIYSSLTAGVAISGNLLNVTTAGSGIHFIDYAYTTSNNLGTCTFSTFDTLEILSSVDMQISNANPSAPSLEACLTDTLDIDITNFPFIPTTVDFQAGGSNVVSVPLDSITVANALMNFAGVYSGMIQVIVPTGARTGKITLRDSISGQSFQSTNFFVIQNPAVTINLLNSFIPVCSNLDTAIFEGIPSGGTFSAFYLGQMPNSALIDSNLLLLDSITGYVNGVQQVIMNYNYIPTYTGTNIECPLSIDETLTVTINNVELDSVHYTPIAHSQSSESMSNLTLLPYPLDARLFPNSYTGTYVIANNLILSSIDSAAQDSIIYEISNGGCSNSSQDPLDIWDAPGILDSIPTFLCSSGGSVFIQRDSQSVFAIFNSDTIYVDSLYHYSNRSNVPVVGPSGYNVTYTEQINILDITSSNGGLVTINPTTGEEEYELNPAAVTGSSTLLTIKFNYSRTANYFDALGGNLISTDVTNYTIAEVSKNIIIENPSTVAINPVILADTVFCPINQNNLLLGTPAGGQYYLNGDSLPNNIFNPLNSHSNPGNSYPLGASYTLTYVYTGQACMDSASTGIYLPDSFKIEIAPGNITGEYCATAANDSIGYNLTYPVAPNTHPIDSNTIQVFVRNVQSGVVFSPTQAGPSGSYPIQYFVSDVYGCRGQALDTFQIHEIPRISMSPLDTAYCLNAQEIPMDLFYTYFNGTTDITVQLTPANYFAGHTASLTGAGIIGGGIDPANPVFEPDTAMATDITSTTPPHRIVFTYTDINSCTDSIIDLVDVHSLPDVSIGVGNSSTLLPLNNYYCENDTIAIQGLPIGSALQSGYGTDTTTATGSNNIVPWGVLPGVGQYASSFDVVNQEFRPNVVGTTPGILEETIYYYYIDDNGCSDTARHKINIRNFTTDPVLVGVIDSICASDVNVTITASPNGGFDLDSLGWFTSPYTDAFSLLGPTPNTVTTDFYPDSAGVQYGGRNIPFTFHYTDTSRSCFNSISDTIWVKPLPFLLLAEMPVTLANNVLDVNFLGSKLLDPPTDTFYHVCGTAEQFPIFAHNIGGYYDPFTGVTTLSNNQIPTGVGLYSGKGVVTDPTGAAVYLAATAGFGLDTITYRYTESTTGCSDSVTYYINVDSLPTLSFAGLSSPVGGKYIYCETEPNPPTLQAAPNGVAGSYYTFNGQTYGAGQPLNLDPAALAVPGTYADYSLEYFYVGQVYQDGTICADTSLSIIEIRPAPELSWTSVPTNYCMVDSAERYPLAATPSGGYFFDYSNGATNPLSAGVIGNSLFNPAAQAGERTLIYFYYDSSSTCSDTIVHTAYVYNQPRINFDIGGGCAGNSVDFIPKVSPYGLLYNGVAIDSITQVIWNYGDGVSDTINTLPDTLVIPNSTHTYAESGVFFPSLTVTNREICDTTFVRRIVISPVKTVTATAPYIENFGDTTIGTGGWFQESAAELSVNGIVTDSLWQYGIAYGSTINTTADQNNVWGTRLSVPGATTYGQGEHAWVYSPCFDLSHYTLDRPMIELSIWRDAQNNIDGAVLQYYDDFTQTWTVLGENQKGINWYQPGFVVSSPGNQFNTPIGWTDSSATWENARYRLDNVGNDLRNRTNVRFRIAFASSDQTLLNSNDGFAFDSVRIGNRSRNVLVEHFSGAGYPGISGIETQLYNTIFNNLYGRDVSLIQYHRNDYANDPFYNFNVADANTRGLELGIVDVNQVRIDGKELVTKTSDLLSYPNLEFLDIEALSDPLFDLSFKNPGLVINTVGNVGTLSAEVRLEALENIINQDDYLLHVVITEDSLDVTSVNPIHKTLAVMRDIYPDNSGFKSYLSRTWNAGDKDTILVNWGFSLNDHVKENLEMTVFLQNKNTFDVYQVASTRDLTIFTGSVDSVDVSVENLESNPSWEVVNLNLFPNPAQDLFNVTFDKELAQDYEWKLFDVVGRVWKEGSVNAGTSSMQIQTNELSAGMYIFAIKNENVYTQRKVIIRRP